MCPVSVLPAQSKRPPSAYAETVNLGAHQSFGGFFSKFEYAVSKWPFCCEALSIMLTLACCLGASGQFSHLNMDRDRCLCAVAFDLLVTRLCESASRVSVARLASDKHIAHDRRPEAESVDGRRGPRDPDRALPGHEWPVYTRIGGVDGVFDLAGYSLQPSTRHVCSQFQDHL